VKKSDHPAQRPVLVTVKEARALTGLGNTKIYELIAKKQLRSTKVGRRRLIAYSSIENLINTGAEAA
jgi:excisionase family DNA binding protein